MSIAEPLIASYRPRQPISLRLTLGNLGRGSFDPTTRWEPDALWRTWRTPDGPATVRLQQQKDGVLASAWGMGREWVIAGLPSLLGADDDWSQLDVSGHPLLREALRRNIGLRLTKTRRVLEALLPAILEQKVTTVEAHRSWAWLVTKYGEPAPGPAPATLRVTPTPQQWWCIPSWEWHRAGVDPKRSSTAIRAARAAVALERGGGSSGIAAGLRSVPGIGQWTVAETLQRSHGDPDTISVGDYHLAHFVGSALTGSRVDDDGMLELLEPWLGHRQRIVRLLYVSGHKAPRFGPRATIQDHRGH